MVDGTCREGIKTGHSALCDGRRTNTVAYEHGPVMSCNWDELDHSMPPAAEAPTGEGKSGSQIAATSDVGILDRVDGSREWPEVLQAHGHVAGIPIDSCGSVYGLKVTTECDLYECGA